MAYQQWNWQHKNWPNFSYKENVIKDLKNTDTVIGVLKHLEEVAHKHFLVEILSDEAMNTSKIEGEYLDRDNVQSSIKQNLGLTTDKRKVPLAEYSVSEMMVDLYLNYHQNLTHQQLFEWQKVLTNGRRDLTNIGSYRTHEGPIQVVSSRLDRPQVHFEAPPSRNG